VAPISRPVVKGAVKFFGCASCQCPSFVASSDHVRTAPVSSIHGCVRITDRARHPSGSSIGPTEALSPWRAWQTKSAAPPSWNEFLDKVIKRSAAQNNGKPNYTRACQPEFKTCYDSITVVASDGKLSLVKVTKDMNDKILRREICSFNDSIDIRACYNWDDGTTHRDMKDSNGNWYKVADE
jgi:hypothetical protein